MKMCQCPRFHMGSCWVSLRSNLHYFKKRGTLCSYSALFTFPPAARGGSASPHPPWTAEQRWVSWTRLFPRDAGKERKALLGHAKQETAGLTLCSAGSGSSTRLESLTCFPTGYWQRAPCPGYWVLSNGFCGERALWGSFLLFVICRCVWGVVGPERCVYTPYSLWALSSYQFL